MEVKQKGLFSQLKTEHKDLKDLLEKAEETFGDERLRILDKIEEEIIPHARAEEKTLYALLRQKSKKVEKKDSVELANEAYEEHRVVDSLLADLKKVDFKSEKWLAHFKVLKENIEHHIKEEENELFEKANSIFTKNELESLKEAYLKEKTNYSKNLPTQGQISESDVSPALKKYG